MKQKMFRLTDDQIKKLKTVAEKRGCTETEVIRSCIDQLGEDTHGTKVESTAILGNQLAEKDAQIKSLLDALHNSQALHAAEKKEAMEEREAMKKEPIALESAEQKKTRWQRLKEAWKG